jgi:hypothetical protein
VEVSRFYRREAAMVVKLSRTLRLGPKHDRTKPRVLTNLYKPPVIDPDAPRPPGFEGADWVPPKGDGAA